MYAVIKTGGKQYSVKVGDVVYVEIAAEEWATLIGTKPNWTFSLA